MAHVDVERQALATVITIDRPDKRNALDVATLIELRDALREAAADPATAALVLTGRGTTFCAGADLSAISLIENLEERRQAFAAEAVTLAALVEEVLEVLTRADVVSIAAINGHAVGGGWSMALGCDFRFSVRDACFWFPEASLGRAVGEASVETVVRHAGPAAAKEILMLARRHSAAWLLARGLLTGVVDDTDGLTQSVDEITIRVAELHAGSLSTVKARVARASGLPAWAPDIDD